MVGKKARSIPLPAEAAPADWFDEGQRCAKTCVPLWGNMLHGETLTTDPCPHYAVTLPPERGGVEPEKARAFIVGRHFQVGRNATAARTN